MSLPNENSNSPRFISAMDGINRCSRYAFGPNRLHYCGPDVSQEVLAYINEKVSDQGLIGILQGFATMYPYLETIAQTNKLKDPFDDRVVEAYWLGNNLLENISGKTYWRHLSDRTIVKKQAKNKHWQQLVEKLRQGARMHHNFHVFNIWKRTGFTESDHTLFSMDQCRISWGKVTDVAGPALTIARQPLITEHNELKLGHEESITIMRELEKGSVIDDVQAGDIISIHWGVPCEILTDQQLNNLKKYTTWSLQLANQTI